MLFLYNVLLWAAFPFLALYYGAKMLIRGKYRQGLGQRFGFFPPGVTEGMQGSPRIWMHAVSVGEVTAAAPIVASLRGMMPDACIVFSTTTETGREMARRIVPAHSFIYYPLDLLFVVRRAIDAISPDIFVLTETELWPNFLGHCRRKNIKVFMANGRLSPRSFRKYRLTRFFWKGIINDLDGVGAISTVDAERFHLLGVPSERLHVYGNAKYDSLASRVSSTLRDEISRALNIEAGEHVLVAGSTHPGEEEIIFGVYEEILKVYRDFKLIIVPRHIERVRAVRALAGEKGFEDTITMAEITGGRKRQNERVIIIDLIGELFKVYGLATVVFCGGSLVPRGGQNILEAAAWGRVVFYGPFMDDFAEERALLEGAEAGVTVKDGDELLSGILKLLSRPSELKRRGEEGRRLVAAHKGAAALYADLIAKAVSDPRSALRG